MINTDVLSQVEKDMIHEMMLRESIPYGWAMEIIKTNKPRNHGTYTHTDKEHAAHYIAEIITYNVGPKGSTSILKSYN